MGLTRREEKVRSIGNGVFGLAYIALAVPCAVSDEPHRWVLFAFWLFIAIGWLALAVFVWPRTRA